MTGEYFPNHLREDHKLDNTTPFTLIKLKWLMEEKTAISLQAKQGEFPNKELLT